MRKKLFTLLLTIALILTLGLSLAACGNDKNDDSEPEKSIVFLGDSIAEAILGPSPLVERERYGYYALLGERTGYKVYNRSVSGHKTGDLIDILDERDEDAKMTRTRIKEADVIHISILGNDFLQEDLGEILLQAVYNNKSDPNSWYSEKINTILHSSNSELNGGNKDGSVANIAKIVETVKNLNPDALLIFQKVYNPVSENTTLISGELELDANGVPKEVQSDDPDDVRKQLWNYGYKPEGYRELADHILDQLNGVLDDYLNEHPGAFEIIDAQTEFNRIYAADAELGKALIYKDYVHPSNYGHAVLADLATELFIEKGIITQAQAVKAYKETRVEQLNKLYKNVEGVDSAALTAEINSADDCEKVTRAYFEATLGKKPVYEKGNEVADAVKRGYQVDKTFYLFNKNDNSYTTTVQGIPLALIMDNAKSKLVLAADGSVKMNVYIKNGISVPDILKMFQGDKDEGNPLMIDTSGLAQGLQGYLSEIIPGFEMDKLAEGLSRLESTLGVKFTGVDLTNANDPVLVLLNSLLNSDNEVDLTNVLKDFSIPEDFGLQFTGKYYIKDIKSGVTGKTYKAVHIGFRDIAEDPFLLLDIEDKDGFSTIRGHVKFIKLILKGSTIAPSV